MIDFTLRLRCTEERCGHALILWNILLLVGLDLCLVPLPLTHAPVLVMDLGLALKFLLTLQLLVAHAFEIVVQVQPHLSVDLHSNEALKGVEKLWIAGQVDFGNCLDRLEKLLLDDAVRL